MASLAATYYQQNRSKEAEGICIRALQLRREMLGERHPDTIESISNLAATYRQQGQWSTAVRFYIEALELRREVLGERHPYTIESMASLAALYHQQEWSENASISEPAELSKPLFGISRDGEQVVSASKDKTVQLWNANTAPNSERVHVLLGACTPYVLRKWDYERSSGVRGVNEHQLMGLVI